MIPRRPTHRVTIQKVEGAQSHPQPDLLAAEEPLEIRLVWEDAATPATPTPGAGPACGIAERALSVTMRTPGDDFELAAGFLFTEGLIERGEDIARISYCVGADKAQQEYNIVSVRLAPGLQVDPARVQRNFYTTSSCGVCGKASLEALEVSGCTSLEDDSFKVPAGVLHGLTATLRKEQEVFEKTGGLHAAALFDGAGKLVLLREDVGRHNALDKLIGERLLAKKIPLAGHIALMSGRASFELLQKALRARIPVLAAVGAPSSLAVELARKFNMTLVGFLRDGRFNIYAGEARIALT